MITELSVCAVLMFFSFAVHQFPAAAGDAAAGITPHQEALRQRLHEACAGEYGRYDYEGASRALRYGTDVNAAAPGGRTALEILLSQRYEQSPRGQEANLAMIILLLGHGAELPQRPAAEENLLRRVMENHDQLLLDALLLRFSPADLLEYGGWPAEPAAKIELGDRTLAVPPPEGFALHKGGGLEDLLPAVFRIPGPPEKALFFVPEKEAGLPAREVTAAAVFSSRRDILTLAGVNDGLHHATSPSGLKGGTTYSFHFAGADMSLTLPTVPVPWDPEREMPSADTQICITHYSFLGPGEPYQLLYYRILSEAGDDQNLPRAFGLLAGWDFAVRAASGALNQGIPPR